jgi:hypothetical protein
MATTRKIVQIGPKTYRKMTNTQGEPSESRVEVRVYTDYGLRSHLSGNTEHEDCDKLVKTACHGY